MSYNYDCKTFLKKENWYYDFEKEDEKTKSGYEQSDLSRKIFKNLILYFDKNYICQLNSDEISIKIKKGNFESEFLFDIMHNPNKPHQPYYLAERKNQNLTFRSIYHTIGNFAPIPRTIITKYYGPNLQFIHKNLNELWCWFLKYMYENWDNWPTKIHEKISFKDYMILSCQHLYYKSIFDKFYMENRDKSLNKINWQKYVKDWNEIIKEDTFEDTLISFNHLFELENVTEIDKRISFLIEARGRCILFLLKQNLNNL